MINLIVLAILIIPFAILPFKGIPEPTRLIKEALFDFTMMGVIVFALKNGLRFEYKNKYLALLALWGFFQFGFNWYYPLVRGLGYNAGTITESLHFLLVVVATLLFCSYVAKDAFIRISKAIVLSGSLIAIFGILQWIGLDPMLTIATYIQKEPRHVAATLDHPNLFGNYMALCLPFCLYLNGLRYKIAFGLIAIALVMSQSSLSIVAGIIGVCIFLLLKYRNRTTYISVFSGGVVFSIFCFITPAFNKFSNGFTGRILAWQEFIKRCVNPIFGNGFGIPKSYGVQFGDNYWMTPHNDYLMIWLCLGFVGLILFVLLIFNTLRDFKYSHSNTLGFAYLASLITFFILMFGSFPMESAPIALIGLVSFWAVSKLR